MTDFLSSLVERSFGSTPAIRPRVAFLFEPAFEHGEASTEVLGPGEGDSVSEAPARDLARPVSDRREEPAANGRVRRRLESDERTNHAAAVFPDPRPDIRAAQPSPEPALQATRTTVPKETDNQRRASAPHDTRQDEVTLVTPRDTASQAALSANGVLPEPTLIAEPSKAAEYDKRGLLVPSRVGASIAADLQRSVPAGSPMWRERVAGLPRAALNHDALGERNVHVTIGRIEVRATGADKVPARERPASPVMGLEEYLRRQARRGGQ